MITPLLQEWNGSIPCLLEQEWNELSIPCRKFPKNLKKLLIYGAFCLKGGRTNFSENVIFNLKPSYFGQFGIASSKGLCNKKKWDHRQYGGTQFRRHRTFRGQNGGTPQNNFQNFLLNIFLKSINEKSNTFQPLLNTHFRAFSDFLSCGSLGPRCTKSKKKPKIKTNKTSKITTKTTLTLKMTQKIRTQLPHC